MERLYQILYVFLVLQPKVDFPAGDCRPSRKSKKEDRAIQVIQSRYLCERVGICVEYGRVELVRAASLNVMN